MAFKLDIFDLLGKLNDPRAGDIYERLSDEEKKGFAPVVTLRWMSGTSDERQIMLLNEFVNPYIFSLGKHPHLLMKLLQVASSKTPKRYNWLAVKSKKKNVLAQRAVEEYFDITPRDVKMMNPFPPEAEVIQMAELLGWEKEDVNKLKKEYKDAA
jgi:hypothetical protein